MRVAKRPTLYVMVTTVALCVHRAGRGAVPESRGGIVRRRRLLGTAVTVAAIALLGAAASGPATAAPPTGRDKPITVMTRNLYLGGDIDRPLKAAAAADPSNPLATLLAFAGANAQLRAIVDATDFPGRSVALAHEIATQKPDLVGLQEVALWRSGKLELPPPLGRSTRLGVADARHVDIDFLATLLKRLRSMGTPYTAVSIQRESDVEGPAFVGLAGIPTGRDVRLTMRDVVLRRVDSRVHVEHATSGSYATTLPFSVGGLTYSFVRGWNAVDVRAGSKRLRFVNTHLESEFRAPAVAQVEELLAGPARVTDRPVVLVCDCNTDPLDSSLGTLPGGMPDAAKDEGYRRITGHGGFTDTWLRVAPAALGFTDGLSETLKDTPAQAATEFDHRIDFVFARGSGGDVAVDRGVVVGRDPAERTPSGVWPSDHAGVVMRLRP